MYSAARYSSIPQSPRRGGYITSVRALEPGTYIKRSTQNLSSARSGNLYHSQSGNLSVYSNSQNVNINMSFGLTAVGVLWALMSILATGTSCLGFFLPYWLEGSILNGSTPVHFGVFRRCNYFRKADLIEECGHYTTFADIPTMTWKICTVVIGVGCILSLFVTLTAILACCVKDFVTQRVGRVCGVIQIIAAVLVGVGLGLYPQGWGHEQVMAACGDSSKAYDPGECMINWGFYLTVGGCGALIVASLLSLQAGTKGVQPYDD